MLARRVFPDGRTRAYAWGRSAAREDVAAAAERLVAMSGQFEQRRLARPAYQLDVLDGFAGEEQLRRRAALRMAWRELGAARRRHDELTRDAAAAEARLDRAARARRGHRGARARHGAAPARRARAPAPRDRARGRRRCGRRGAGAGGRRRRSGLVALAERAIAPLERLAPELERAGNELRDVELRLRETASELRAFLASLEAEPDRLEQVESELDRIAETRRRFRCESYEELLGARGRGQSRARGARRRHRSGRGRRQGARRGRGQGRRARRASCAPPVARRPIPSPRPWRSELQGIGLGEGEFRVELREREPSASGADEVSFLIRPNAGLPFAPVAETASGGELSRIALAIAAVGGGETMVFDEIDAGIGGQTAHAVGETLRRLAERAQVVTITHLPQIASLADRHFRVEKVPGDPTHTTIAELGDDERRDELQRMLGGEQFIAAVQQER